MTEPLLTPAATTAADQATIAAGTPGPVLMGRAGRAVARSVLRLLGGAYGRRVVVVCGGGNNGGDGLVAADELARRGVRVERALLAEGIDRDRLARALGRADAVVDAMFGTGFRGALDGDAAAVVAMLGHAGVPVVAVDVPSGVDGLTGAVRGPAVRAALTVTFTARKPGHLFEPGRAHAGELEVVDVGVVVPGSERDGVVTAADAATWLPARAPDAHKWSAGVLVVGGSAGMTGAPSLVARAALRAGAGIVHCAVPGAPAAERIAGGEVIAVELPAGPHGALAPGAVEQVLGSAPRFHAAVVGPGLGADPAARAAAARIVAGLPVPVVVDADGLNALAGDPAPLRARRDAGAPAAVLTPHDGEFARLAGQPVGGDRMAAARGLAAETGAVVLLKGPATVVAEPGGRVLVSTTGGPWLATAGTGDVLAGIVGAFLARGATAAEAAAAAAWVHGRAADVAGHAGLVASDLLAALPSTLERIGGPPGAPTRRARRTAPD